MKIYVIRHGETNANRDGLLQGRIDKPLNEDGEKLAIITGEKMSSIKFDACFSSSLKRAKRTAELILENSGNKDVDIQIDDRLIEIDMGIDEGKKFRKGEREAPVYRLFLFKYLPFLLGHFPKGESIREVCKRTQEFLLELKDKNYENVLISTHGCAMRAMLNRFYKFKFFFWQGIVPYNCAVNIIEVNNGKMELVEKDKVYYDPSLCVDRYK